MSDKVRAYFPRFFSILIGFSREATYSSTSLSIITEEMRGEPCEILHSVSRERNVIGLSAETRNRFGKGVQQEPLAGSGVSPLILFPFSSKVSMESSCYWLK